VRGIDHIAEAAGVLGHDAQQLGRHAVGGQHVLGGHVLDLGEGVLAPTSPIGMIFIGLAARYG
jgi:hypothetical protein